MLRVYLVLTKCGLEIKIKEVDFYLTVGFFNLDSPPLANIQSPEREYSLTQNVSQVSQKNFQIQ